MKHWEMNGEHNSSGVCAHVDFSPGYKNSLQFNLEHNLGNNQTSVSAKPFKQCT